MTFSKGKCLAWEKLTYKESLQDVDYRNSRDDGWDQVSVIDAYIISNMSGNIGLTDTTAKEAEHE